MDAAGRLARQRRSLIAPSGADVLRALFFFYCPDPQGQNGLVTAAVNATFRRVNTPSPRSPGQFFPCMNTFCKTLLALSLLSPGVGRTAEEPPSRIGLKLLSEGFTAPNALISMPDGSGRKLVSDQAGFIYVLGRDGQKLEKPFLNIQSKLVELG